MQNLVSKTAVAMNGERNCESLAARARWEGNEIYIKKKPGKR
jgi:hypothetical protein